MVLIHSRKTPRIICAQEEARLVTREENIGANKDQALTVHTRKNYRKKEKKENFHQNEKDKKQKKTKRDPSEVIPLEEISTQNGPFNFNSNSMSSCVSQ